MNEAWSRIQHQDQEDLFAVSHINTTVQALFLLNESFVLFMNISFSGFHKIQLLFACRFQQCFAESDDEGEIVIFAAVLK